MGFFQDFFDGFHFSRRASLISVCVVFDNGIQRNVIWNRICHSVLIIHCRDDRIKSEIKGDLNARQTALTEMNEINDSQNEKRRMVKGIGNCGLFAEI